MKIQQNDDENEGNINYQKILPEALEFHAGRTFSYQAKAPSASESHRNPLSAIYSIKTSMSTKSGFRKIPSKSEQTLDGPDFINDYCKEDTPFDHLNVFFAYLPMFIILYSLNRFEFNGLECFEYFNNCFGTDNLSMER